ncbi:hypothetical protein [Paraburkholderia strydomiana]|uniref:hypothetical protein n=1 Tax=Paraburkholderia strydomiana TaxID=1245417 RepID=UPI0028563E6C|nr:hypothetical protein [Paraburkholderia strydomiana]MDR7006653.1 hypothetical protein [Paraburkholderia strydomiana]
MPIVDITARLEMFEGRVEPKSEMDQLRAAFYRLQCLFVAPHSQRQVWEDLEKAGLQMGFDGFKTALQRIGLEREGVKKDSRKMEGASETSACVHCWERIGGKGADGGSAVEPSTDVSEPGQRMGSSFGRRLADGSLDRGLMGGNGRSSPSSN